LSSKESIGERSLRGAIGRNAGGQITGCLVGGNPYKQRALPNDPSLRRGASREAQLCQLSVEAGTARKQMADALLVIPARLASTRLPAKPLADLCGRPMIVHVLERATKAAVGPVVVATDSEEIVAAVGKAGGRAVMTRGDHPSGSDRVHEAADLIDPERRMKIVINVQGDMPSVEPGAIAAALRPLLDASVDIATTAAEIRDPAARDNPNFVKVVGSPVAAGRLRALYFTRASAPWGEGPLFHHFGLYAFRREALDRFVGLPPSPLELREKLEQLRALEAGMRIDVAIVERAPPEVNTPEDLDWVRASMRA
jgi:3-deoxy-manno-octulosonate cytidylyltransferase (CMP-KDO synthetase)